MGADHQLGRPTKRAVDLWDFAASTNIFLASGFSCSQTESTFAPAPCFANANRWAAKKNTRTLRELEMPSLFDQFANIQPELEEVRQNFLRLLELIPDDALDRRFPGEGWTIKQELVHIVQAVAILPKGIKRAVQGKSRSALSFIPTNIRSWFNGLILIPLAARRATRASIVEACGQAFNTLMKTLQELPEEAWHKGCAYPRQYRTIEQMAHRPAEHFEEHVAHLCRLLKIDSMNNQHSVEERRA
jgi:hypothetical protein